VSFRAKEDLCKTQYDLPPCSGGLNYELLSYIHFRSFANIFNKIKRLIHYLKGTENSMLLSTSGKVQPRPRAPVPWREVISLVLRHEALYLRPRRRRLRKCRTVPILVQDQSQRRLFRILRQRRFAYGAPHPFFHPPKDSLVFQNPYTDSPIFVPINDQPL